MEEIIDTSGFYKNDNENLLYGPNYVIHKDFDLVKETKNQYEYPVDGWYWFDSEKKAKIYFNIG